VRGRGDDAEGVAAVGLVHADERDFERAARLTLLVDESWPKPLPASCRSARP
jgi:hypothetical protein